MKTLKNIIKKIANALQDHGSVSKTTVADNMYNLGLTKAGLKK